MAVITKGRSAHLSYDSLTYVEADKSIRLRHDEIIVEPLDVDHNLPTLAQLGFIVQEDMRPLRGIVKAVGPGHYPWRYDHPDKHKRTKMWKSKTFQPTEVKVGDVVELGRAQETRGYAFQTFMWGDKLHVICREADVAGVEIRPTQTELNALADALCEIAASSEPIPDRLVVSVSIPIAA